MNFIKNLWLNRRILINLIKSDFRNRYLGSYLGIVWAFIQPVVMILVYWFVFVHGFRSPPVANLPFLPWFLAGLIPWLLVNDAIISSSRAIIDQSFFVKKIVFEVKFLPIIKIGSAFLVNVAFWFFLLICCLCFKIYPTWYWLQVFYYLFCALILSIGFSLLLSSITVFVLDMGQFVSIIFQILFWMTPIFWNQQVLPHKYIMIVKLNPFAYIISGMRDTLFYNLPIWVHYNLTIYFWGFNLLLFYVGNKVFNRLRPHFADVL